VGAGAKTFTLIEKFAPAVGDRFKVATSFEGSRTDEPARDDDTLFAPRPGAPRVRGRYQGHVMKTSISTAATLRPLPTLLAAATIGAGIAFAMRTRSEE
jgi:hypothetical protein